MEAKDKSFDVSYNSQNSDYTNAWWIWNPNPWKSPVTPQLQPIQTHRVISTNSALYIKHADPEVFITKNKSRVKIYKSEQTADYVYLEDGDEFEIELFNPTPKILGVKIQMNGEDITESYIVIYPGQRIFLERFVRSDRKFKYATYMYDKEAGSEAIKNNGTISVSFFYEKLRIERSNYIPDNSNLGGRILFSNSVCTNFVSEETGAIEEGGKSDMTFKNVEKQFEQYHSYSFNYRIMPMSQKPIEAKDLVRKCSGCGHTLKKNFIYCPKCATKA
jgi:hypothetical protein